MNGSLVGAALLFCAAGLMAATAVTLADDVRRRTGRVCPTLPATTVAASTTTPQYVRVSPLHALTDKRTRRRLRPRPP